jgi:Fe-S cluster assembly scaffold protein SufB
MNHSDVRDEQQHALILQLTAERDALKAELKLEQESRISRRLYEQDTECLRHDRNVWKNRFEVSEAENQRLRAELALERADNVQYKQDALVLLDKLTELREAAEALEKRARTEAEFLQSEGYKRGMYLEQDCDEFKAVLAKLTP